MLQSIIRRGGWEPDPEDPDIVRARAERAKRIAREAAHRRERRARTVLLELGHFPARADVVAVAATRFGDGSPTGLSRIQVLRVAAVALRIRANEGARRIDVQHVSPLRPSAPEPTPVTPVPSELDEAIPDEVSPMANKTAEPPLSARAKRERREKEIREFVARRIAEDPALANQPEQLRAEAAKSLGYQLRRGTFATKFMPTQQPVRRRARRTPPATVAMDPASAEPIAPAPPPSDSDARSALGETEHPVGPSGINRLLDVDRRHPRFDVASAHPPTPEGVVLDSDPGGPWAWGPHRALRYEVTEGGKARVLIDVEATERDAMRLIQAFAETFRWTDGAR